jgi:hypothetical protein
MAIFYPSFHIYQLEFNCNEKLPPPSYLFIDSVIYDILCVILHYYHTYFVAPIGV